MSHRDLDHLAAAVLEATATPEQYAELEAQLDTDPDAFDRFVRLAEVHATLGWELQYHRTPIAQPAPHPAAHRGAPKPRGAAQRTPGVPAPAPAPAISNFQFSIFNFQFQILAAALLLGALTVGANLLLNNPQSEIRNPQSAAPIATLIASSGNVIINDDLANDGDEYAPGLYAIDSGEAELLLNNAVGLKLTDRAAMVVHSDMAVTVQRGTVEFDCPPAARGFTVHLPGGVHVVDLGTRFRVHIDPGGGSRVRVLSGLVRFNGPQDQSIDLHTGELAGASRVAAGVRIARIGPPAPRLTAYYDFEGEGDDRLDDPAGEHRDNLTLGGAQFVADPAPGTRGSTAALFDGRSTLYTPGFTPDLGPDRDAFTIMFWIKARHIDQTMDNIRVMSTRYAADGGYSGHRWQIEGIGKPDSRDDLTAELDIRIQDKVANRVWMAHKAPGAVGHGDAPARWHHVAFVLANAGHPEHGGAYGRTFVDGVSVGGIVEPATDFNGRPVGNEGGCLVIGGMRIGQPARAMVGQLDDVALFAGVVPDELIAAIAAGHASPADFISTSSDDTGSRP